MMMHSICGEPRIAKSRTGNGKAADLAAGGSSFAREFRSDERNLGRRAATAQRDAHHADADGGGKHGTAANLDREVMRYPRSGLLDCGPGYFVNLPFMHAYTLCRAAHLATRQSGRERRGWYAGATTLPDATQRRTYRGGRALL